MNAKEQVCPNRRCSASGKAGGRAFQFSWLLASEQAQASVGPGAHGPKPVHHEPITQHPDQVQGQIASHAEPRRNLSARQPILAETDIAHPVEPVLNLTVPTQALQGLPRAQMPDATAARLIRSASTAARGAVDGLKQHHQAQPTKERPERLKGRDAVAVKGQTAGQTLRVRPGPQPHAPQGGLPVDGGQDQDRRQGLNGVAMTLPALESATAARTASKLRPSSTACMTPPPKRLQPKIDHTGRTRKS